MADSNTGTVVTNINISFPEHMKGPTSMAAMFILRVAMNATRVMVRVFRHGKSPHFMSKAACASVMNVPQDRNGTLVQA